MNVSGEAFAKLAGKAWDAADKIGSAAMKEAGNNIITASPEFVEEIKKATAHIEADYVKKADTKGVDGAAALKYYRDQIKNY